MAARSVVYTDAVKMAKLVQQATNEKRRLFERMDDDYRLWRMEWEGPDPSEGIKEKDFYYSNKPRVLADRISSYVSHARRLIRVQNLSQDQKVRESNDLTERLAIGLLNLGDRRLTRTGHPMAQGAQAWHATVLGGWVSGRMMLRKNDMGRTIVDIAPFNPRHTVFEMGDEGPLWLSHHIVRSKAYVRDTFPDYKLEGGPDDRENADLTDLYDCYYADNGGRFWNGVIIRDGWARPPTETFTPQFPCPTVLVGDAPVTLPGENVPGGISADDFLVEHIGDVGESVFSAIRLIVDAKNRAMTYRQALAAKAVNRSYKLSSPDGAKTLDINPNTEATEINLQTGQEDVEWMELSQMTRDADVYLERVSEEEVVGGLPPQAHGILDVPLSGTALRQLSSNIEQKVRPGLRAVEQWFQQGVENLVGQYESGSYEPMNVSGKTADRAEFSQVIGPMAIEGHGELEVELVAEYPEEEALKWQVAGLALTPTQPTGEPLMSLDWVRDTVLKIPNRDKVRSENMEHMGRLGDPLARAHAFMTAAEKAGDEGLWRIWYDEAKKIMIIKAAEAIKAQLTLDTTGLMAAQFAAMTGQQPGNPEDVSSELSPAAGNPMFQPQPSPDAGANTTSSRSNGKRPVGA